MQATALEAETAEYIAAQDMINPKAGGLGVIDLRQGRHRKDIGHQRQALALIRGSDDRRGEASVLSRPGLIDLDRDPRFRWPMVISSRP
jgi:hypothetical protein